MEIFVLVILIGLIPAVIAQGKGRSFVLWWIYGAALFIVALPHSLIMKVNTEELENRKISDGMKKCQYCAELIKEEAVACRYCGRELTEEKAQSSEAPINAPSPLAQSINSQLMKEYPNSNESHECRKCHYHGKLVKVSGRFLCPSCYETVNI